jgi:hypothetical protein
MKVDSISKALRDGEKCVELAPQWAKGYNRLAAAQLGLKRYVRALITVVCVFMSSFSGLLVA